MKINPTYLNTMYSINTSNDASCFSKICVEQCKGRCCNPWWGIISFHVNKRGGLSNLIGFKNQLVRDMKARKERIKEQYVTRENLPRRLFNDPLKQHLSVEKIDIREDTISLTLRAMFAFRCAFLSDDNACSIHPSITATTDIRPPHCGYMGSLNATQNEKGYCRIIHRAEAFPGDNAEILDAVNTEKASSDNFLNTGVDSEDEAADNIIDFIYDYCSKNAPHLLEKKTKAAIPGRNEPCHCGSGKKYKKCHGQ